MEPNQQPNYWKQDPEESAEPAVTELYAPTTDETAKPTDTATEPKPIPQPADSADVAHWTATEYINQEKSTMWFVIFGLIAAVFIATDLIFLKSYTFSLLVAVMAVSIIVFARRPPRDIKYTLSGQQGLYVGERLYHFSDFKSFGYVRDGEHDSIMLIPVKRFSPAVSVYFPQESGEKIVDILGARLPMLELKLDIIDIIVRKLRL
ncbi:MAG: hypothetical protein WCI79_00735 [Candidatus Saccharibacteria bacterium]